MNPNNLEQLKPMYEKGVRLLEKAKAQANGDDAYLSAATGQLPENIILRNMFDKIAAQYFVQAYNYQNEIIGRYMKASTAYGGVDEIVSFGMALHRDFDYSWDWTKDRFYNNQYTVWAKVEYKDQYLVTTSTILAQQAFTSLANFGSAIGQMLQGVMNAKNQVWYERLRDIYKQYPIVIEIDGDPTDNDPQTGYGAIIGQSITNYMNQLTLPSRRFNVAGQTIATPYDRQQLVLNAPYVSKIQWSVARLYNPQVVDNLGKVTFQSFIDFEDDNIIGVLDTAQSIYIGLKSSQPSYQIIGANLETNQYLTEVYTQAIVPFQPTILFKAKGAPSEAKTPLDSVVTTTDVKIKGGDANGYIGQLMAAIEAANDGYTFSGNELLAIQKLNLQTGKGVATLNPVINSPYEGRLTITFTIDPSASSNFGI